MRLYAIIPALDEAETIGGVVSAVLAEGASRVVVCDNGSSDETGARALAAGAEVVCEPRRGYGSACLAALELLHPGKADDVVLFIDGDGQSDPNDIGMLVAPIANGDADLVIGSRVVRAEPGALTATQRFGNWLATRLLARFYGASATDLGPTRAASIGALRRLAMRERGFGWTVEMQARAALIGLRVREVPVRYRRRSAGHSKISGTLRGSAHAGAVILWTLHSARKKR